MRIAKLDNKASMGNYNVWLTFVFRVCDGVATGIWSSSVLSNYISVSQGGDDYSNEKVGIAQAVQGTFLVAAALPAAWMTSRLRRDTILKGMGFMAYLAIASMSAALLMFADQQQYLVLCGALALWGIAQANAPVLDSLFADSVPTGKRAALYTWLHISYLLSQGLGPAVAALLFFLRGDDWSVERMKAVMVAGMALAVVPATLLWCFNDDKALGEESEGLLKLLNARKRTSGESAGSRPADDVGLHQPLLGSEGHEHAGGGAWYSDEDERDLEGFNTPTAIHSPLTGQDMLTQARSPSSQPTSPTRATARETHPTFDLHSTADALATAGLASQLQATEQGPADGAHVAAEGQGVVQQGQDNGEEPDPESHAIDLSEDAGTVYSSRLSNYSTGAGSFTDLTALPAAGPHTPSRLRAVSDPQSALTNDPSDPSSLILTPAAISQHQAPSSHLESTQHNTRSEQLMQDASVLLGSGALPGPAVLQSGALPGPAVLQSGALPGPAVLQSGALPGPAVLQSGALLGPAVLQSSTAPHLRYGATHPASTLPHVATSSLQPVLEHVDHLTTQPGDMLSLPSGLLDIHAGGALPPNIAQLRGSALADSNSSLDAWLPGQGRGSSFHSLASSASSTTGLLQGPSRQHPHTPMHLAIPQSSGVPDSLLRRGAGNVDGLTTSLEQLQYGSGEHQMVEGAPGPSRPPSLVLKPHPESTPGSPAGEEDEPSTPTPFSGGKASAVGTANASGPRFGASSRLAAVGLGASSTMQPGLDVQDNAAHDTATDCEKVTGGTPAHIRIKINSPSRSRSAHGSRMQHGVSSPAGHKGLPSPQRGSAQRAGNTPARSAGVATASSSAAARKRQGWGTNQPWSSRGSKRNALGARSCWCLGPAAIPVILACTDMVMGLASGMTIKFFPIFFRQQVSLSPVYVNLMYCAVPLCLSLAAAIAQRQSLLIGKVPTMTMNRAIGISLLIWIAIHVEIWSEPRIMVPVYIIRTSIMNANYPIQRSILMDFVPKEQRAKWASLESVTSFGWSGSAALGGFLIHKYGFQVTFFITAAMQAIGWTCSLLLLPIVPCFDITPAELQARTRQVQRRGSSRV